MMTRLSRRRSLYVLVWGVVPLAGCSQPPKAENTTIEVSVFNYRGTFQRVGVQAFRGDEPLFKRNYSLEAGKADESEEIKRVPTRILLRIENETTTSFEYSVPTGCESPEVIVRLEREGELVVSNGCPGDRLNGGTT